MAPLYSALVIPHVNCVQSKEDTNKLGHVQRRVSKMVRDLASEEESLEEMGMFSLEQKTNKSYDAQGA